MESLKIAVVATPFIRVPPEGYGGTELFCANLVRELTDLGHRVTLFATGDSSAPCLVRALYPTPIWPPDVEVEKRHLTWALEQVAAEKSPFDVVHLNSPFALPIARGLKIRKAVCTLHHARDPALSAIYSAEPWARYVGISHRQLELEVSLPYASVIYHGLDPVVYPPAFRPGSTLVHIGRFAPEKGTHDAMDAAREVGMPLVLAGRCHEIDRAYYEREVRPRLEDAKASGRIEMVGEANHPRKVELLRSAVALLCPIHWEEPFGLIAVEAMLCGTPVVGFRRGSFTEIVDDGITGTLVDDGDFSGLCEALENAHRIDRRACARRARERFSASKMTEAYERLFGGLAFNATPRSTTQGRSLEVVGRKRRTRGRPEEPHGDAA
jgi:glycosyltransferase involved in cell wall biosynthesis